jgi:hypothetical protein
MLAMAMVDAVCPALVAKAPTPPSSAAILFSKTSQVGFDILEYMCPLAFKSKRSATLLALSYA